MTGLLEAVGMVIFYFCVPAIVGGLLHELTHTTVVVALGHDLVGMNLHRVFVGLRSGSTVIYELNHDSRLNTLIGTAPLLIGGTAAVVWWLVGQPLTGPTGAALAIGWVFYTLNISREDAMGGDIEPAPRLDKAIHGAFIGAVGLALYQVVWGPTTFIAYTLFIAGFAIATINFAAWADEQDLDTEPGVGEEG